MVKIMGTDTGAIKDRVKFSAHLRKEWKKVS